ncbi:MAG: RtcB family protein [Candidatus Riflebacteria bacterium]|nr:RtcB family protein [Candidatus Riflebacteria bacterium]
MEWIKDKSSISPEARVPIKSWCPNPEAEAISQAADLAAHPAVSFHVALMPDCHVGYGMPIGGVIACRNAVIPNAVGVDIGCGMGAVKTSLTADNLSDMRAIRSILDEIKKRIPVGEGNSHKHQQEWDGFDHYEESVSKDSPGWFDSNRLNHDRKNLGTLGGGNHFLEIQASTSDEIWMMLHSGSRNLGYRIASFYHKLAQKLNSLWSTELPTPNLAFLPIDSEEGQAYIRDMKFALNYARENRNRMMKIFKEVMLENIPGIEFIEEINIHHNYAVLENHFGQNVWVHRKGATSAKAGESGIIPGSMGTSSYIVKGLGNPDSFSSCSHGAGRTMGRGQASRSLSLDECDKAMKGIVFDRWHKEKSSRRKGKGAEYDFGEAPQAYKNIDQVIQNQLDLIEPLVKLRPLGVIKG